MGVYDKTLVEPIANVLKSLGSKHVMHHLKFLLLY
jgi:anthranilate phosphoribosyltransferase